MSEVKLFQGDCLEIMKTIPDDSIDLTVTSPPYDNLRAYNGNTNWNFDKFKDIASKLYQVTAAGGVLVWVVGDATIKGSETGTSFEQALYFKSLGFNLHDTMIYAKNNPIPQNHNRYEQCFEYMFVLSKGKPKTFNGIRVETKNADKTFSWGGRKTIMDENQCRRHREEKDMIKVKPDKLHNNIFYYSIGGGNTGHPAVFPEQLATDHIISWSNEGDTVLDPFMGSGTTGKMAVLNNRNFVGIELDENYFKIASDRIHNCQNIE